ncbi:carboxypeptidase regulatory-like domain-containing protein, partial [Klebsiella pneumoniae]|uniref:carboxypeptidase regulatory-like domain-containing protein n=1 Tax=Klebsiella pneumoniae TaxID=573 RepID=UPI0038522119
LSMNGYAQQNGIVKGNVTDTLLHKGLAYTTISLVKQKDSTLISFSRADSSGNFKINNIAAGNYLLSFSYVGYMPVWKPI